MQTEAGPTAYDAIAYPAGVFRFSHPGHLAAVARLHGLSPPPVATARVLDIGGGEGLNLLSLAEALPGAELVTLDLAAGPIARGRAIAAAAGFANVRLEVADILEAQHTLAGPFDYVIAHGVYAWVPALVREALLALIGRVLAPGGAAFVSYNALPGGHFRQMLREMTLHEVGHLPDPDARAAAAKRFLLAFAAPREGDPATLVAVRGLARELAAKEPNALLHDELGEVFQPQAFADVIAAAAPHGLRFLNEADPGDFADGLPDAVPADEEALIRAVQARDHAEMRFFRQTLFVRDGQVPSRVPMTDCVADLHVSARCERPDANTFKSEFNSVTIDDARLLKALAIAAEAWPARPHVGDLIDDAARLGAFYRLFRGKIVELGAMPFPGVTRPGEAPRASRLARAMVAAGQPRVATLDGRTMAFEDAAARAFLLLLDGTRDRAALAGAWAGLGLSEQLGLDQALARFAAASLMMA